MSGPADKRAAGLASMTGFGAGALELGGRRYALEVRAVNHRYLDLKVTLPRPLGRHESVVTAAVRARLRRGRVEVVARLAGTAEGAEATASAAGGGTVGATVAGPRVEVDLVLARAVHEALEKLRATLGVVAPVSLELVTAQRDVLLVADDSGDGVADAQTAARLGAAVGDALDQLTAMRAAEGRALERDLRAALAEARAAAAAIGAAATGRVEEQHARLKERLARLVAKLGAAPVDEARLAQEIVLLADRLDVSEELARLGSHFAQMDELLGGRGGGEGVGRAADFLVQEMGREANTIGAKSQDPELTRQVVALKGALERLREQIQNVE
ncbi:MAG TPA: DUF1732 domain-containing protein [Myxococcota bacterium]|nr:DUF1732 domain-containing protein [Myxococcota bacterium]